MENGDNQVFTLYPMHYEGAEGPDSADSRSKLKGVRIPCTQTYS